MGNFSDKQIENALLKNSDYEAELEKQIQQEILESQMENDKVPVIIKDQKMVSANFIWDKDTIYKVYNRTHKTESFVRGDQAEALIKYTDDYVVRFDHRIEYE